MKLQNKLEVVRIALILMLIVSGTLHPDGFWSLTSYAALSGEGTEASPYTGQVRPADEIRPGAYVMNLSTVDGTEIRLTPVYEPKQYQVVLDAKGGKFADGLERKTIQVIYNDGSGSEAISLPADPKKNGYIFGGWYLKGNRRPNTPSSVDGCIIKNGTRFLIACDDTEDAVSASINEAGQAEAKAVWIPDPKGRACSAVAYVSGITDRGSYEREFGQIEYAYAELYIDGGLVGAESYRWYVKRNGSDVWNEACIGAELQLHNLQSEQNGDIYRCDAIYDGGNGTISCEYPIKVYALAQLGETHISINGRTL